MSRHRRLQEREVGVVLVLGRRGSNKIALLVKLISIKSCVTVKPILLNAVLRSAISNSGDALKALNIERSFFADPGCTAMAQLARTRRLG